MEKNDYYIRKCLELSLRGSGYVSPNPMVGCIIVKNGKIIGRGYHKNYGSAHAEINAINDAKNKGYNLKGATLYVNLEPCNHFGKTPPCTEAIIKEKIGKVIIGMKDPNRNVKGNGIFKLKKSGIKVTEGILTYECSEVNKFYIKYISRKLPYVTLKIAQSLDGKIALDNLCSKWITNESARRYVHKLRSIYDSVLIGKNTVFHDNPSLTVRDVKGRNPVRFVTDIHSNLPPNLNIYTDDNFLNTYTFISSKMSELKSIADKKINKIFIKERKNKFAIKDILKAIYSMGISSVLVEGGGNIFSQFILEDLFDDIYIMIAPKITGKGISYTGDFKINRLSDSKFLFLDKAIYSDGDIILYYKNIKRKG